MIELLSKAGRAKFRIALAARLLKGSDVVLTKRGSMEQIRDESSRLLHYVNTSGGLREPRKIRAFNRVWDMSSSLYLKAREATIVS